jgi:hypothetical protein
MPGVLELSQVIVAVPDLGQARARYSDELGFTVVDGGTHPKLGTANCVIPLGGAYVELLGVVDPEIAARTEFGRAVLDRASRGERLARWSLRTDQIDAIAQVHGLEPEQRARVTPRGERLTWRAAGIFDAVRRPCQPFFMEWDDPLQYPGAIRTVHPNGATRVSELVLATDAPDELRAWIGDADAPVVLEPGPCDLVAATIVDASEMTVTVI